MHVIEYILVQVCASYCASAVAVFVHIVACMLLLTCLCVRVVHVNFVCMLVCVLVQT